MSNEEQKVKKKLQQLLHLKKIKNVIRIMPNIQPYIVADALTELKALILSYSSLLRKKESSNQMLVVDNDEVGTRQFQQILIHLHQRKHEQTEHIDYENVLSYIAMCSALFPEIHSEYSMLVIAKYISFIKNMPSLLNIYIELCSQVINSTIIQQFFYICIYLSQKNNQNEQSLAQFYLLNIIKLVLLISQKSKSNCILVYSFENYLMLSYLRLIYRKNKQLNKYVKILIKQWSKYLTKTQCRQACYSFSQRALQRNCKWLLKIKNISIFQRLQYTLLQIVDQLKTQYNKQNKKYYLALNFIMQLKLALEYNYIFKIEINQSKCIEPFFCLTIQTSYSKYFLVAALNRIFQFQSKQNDNLNLIKSEQIAENNIKQWSKFRIYISQVENFQKNKQDQQIINKVIIIIKSKEIEIFLKSSILKLQISMHNYALLKNVQLQCLNTKNSQTFFLSELKFAQTDGFLLKVKNIQQIKESNYIDNFDFKHYFCLLLQIAQSNKNMVQWAYQKGIQISIIFIKYLQTKTIVQHQIYFMVIFFELLPIEQTNIEVQYTQCINTSLYQSLLIAAYLDEKLFNRITNKDKVMQQIKKCMQDTFFRQNIQNKSVKIFNKLIEIAIYYKQQCVFQLLNDIIITHILNQLLIEKLNKYWMHQQIRDSFVRFLNPLLMNIDQIQDCHSALKKNKNHVCQRQKVTFILNSSLLNKNMIRRCDIETVQKILDYYLMTCPESTTIIFILEGITNFNHFTHWIICFFKYLIFSLRQECNTMRIIGLLSCFPLLKKWHEYVKQNEKEAIVISLIQLIYCIKINQQIITKDIYRFVSDNRFIQYFIFIFQTNLFQNKIQELLHALCQILNRMPKQYLQLFLTRLRKLASLNLALSFLNIVKRLLHWYQIPSLCAILQYLYQCLFLYKNAELRTVSLQILNTITKIDKVLFDVCPRIYSNESINNKNDFIALQKYYQNQEFIQIKGGIYFNTMLIVLILLERKIQTVILDIVQLLLLPKVQMKKITQKINRLSNDFNFGQLHRIDRTNQLIQKESSFNSKNDLSGYMMDFFTMRAVKYLQSCENNYTRLCEKLSIILATCIRNNKSIIDSFNIVDKPRTLIYQIEEIEPQSLTLQKNLFFTPKKTDNDAKRKLYTEPKQSTIFKRLFQNSGFQSADLYELLRTNERDWVKVFPEKMLFRRFAVQAKQLSLYEMLHHHYLKHSSSKLKTNQSFEHLPANNLIVTVQDFQKNQSKQIAKSMMEKQRMNVIKIVPYTTKKVPVLCIETKAFENGTTPMTKLIDKYVCPRKNIFESFIFLNEQSQLKLHSKTNINQVQEQQDQQSIQSPTTPLRKYSQDDFYRKINIIPPFCELITCAETLFCLWQLQEQALILTSQSERPKTDYFLFGTPTCNLSKNSKRVSICYEQMRQIQYRKYNQILNNSIEIFCENGEMYFLTFYIKANLQYFLDMLRRKTKVKIVKYLAREFKRMGFTEKWVNGEMSNFDYLMQMNKYAGRSLCDTNQYYVFPWVLDNYSSKSIELNDPKIYRELDKPIGALNPNKLKRYLQRRETQDASTGYYLYGSHYSTSLFVFYYLLRVQPYSSLHRSMQSGNWDAADRLFSSVEAMWECLKSQSMTSDIKEAVPEFYYMPCMFKNLSEFDFGQKQSGEQVSGVELPRWSKSPEIFVSIMRDALESDYVSQTLHHWIDLIFGKYQHSQQKNNTFHPYSYYNQIDVLKIEKNLIEPLVCQIAFFGQNSIRIFQKQHRAKRIIQENIPMMPYEIIQMPVEKNVEKINIYKKKIIFSIFQINEKRRYIYEMSVDKIDINQLLGQHKKQYKKLDVNSFFPGNNSFYLPLQHIVYNEIFIINYGKKGLFVYNWQNQQIWKCLNKNSVQSVYLNISFMIYSNGGALKLFSFTQMKEIIIYQQNCFQLIFVSHMLPRVIYKGTNKMLNQSNIISLKMITVTDRKKISSFQCNINITNLFTLISPLK